MTDINTLFFELIQIALGVRVCLSHSPTVEEWKALYDMAKKQSLVGVCFAGVQKLQTQRQEPPEMLYLTWMGMAAKIQQRNEVINKQCVELQARLAADGLESAILKGQGVGALYNVNANLALLRQSGDIDVYVPCGMEKALAYVNEKYGKCEYDYINAHLPFYEDTEVELHWRLQAMENPCLNRKLQKWTEEHVNDILGGSCVLPNGEKLTVPSAEVNCFYILLHAYHHVMSEGLGLRQLMDFYFVLRTSYDNDTLRYDNDNILRLYRQFGMMRFARGVMWIMKEVFRLDNKCLLCEPDEKEGRFLLNEVMMGGNFGHHDERMKKIGSGKMVSVMNEVQHSISIASHYPSAVFWRPIWIIYHFLWKRLKRI